MSHGIALRRLPYFKRYAHLQNFDSIPVALILTLQRVWHANRGRLLLRTPGPVPFGTCICSNAETILS